MTPEADQEPAPGGPRSRSGLLLLGGSVLSRLAVLLLLCAIAMWTEYLNLKVAYDNPRLVELAAGKWMRMFYECSEWLFSRLGDPLAVAQSSGGMTWSIRLLGVPFTDPVAALSVLLRNRGAAPGFLLGALVPVLVTLLFGRVFCSYICPASLVFFCIARLRRLLARCFYFPQLTLHRGVAWGILAGGLLLAMFTGHGIWILVLPYFAVGQTIFHGLAFGALAAAIWAVVVFCLADLCLGHQFTCRYLCPTGRLLGGIARQPPVSVRRDADRCLTACSSCADVCPLQVNPKLDETRDCSLCGECLIVCPTNCLSVGREHK